MKIKTLGLTDAALLWVVATIEWPNDSAVLEPELTTKEGIVDNYNFADDAFNLIALIERERITAIAMPDGTWDTTSPKHTYRHDTWLHAILRCHVANKLGDEVEVPDHLL